MRRVEAGRHLLDDRKRLERVELPRAPQPTGEELARFIFARVQLGLGAAATVVSVTVAEDATLSATYRGE